VTEEQKGKVISSFTILGCKTDVIEDSEGKRHFESECLSKEARDKFASIFEQEAILRVNPKVVLEEIPPVAPPAATPVIEPVTES